MSGLKYWLALTEVAEIGPVTAKKLLSVYGKPEAVFESSYKELCETDGMTVAKAKNIKDYAGWNDVAKQVKKIEDKGIKVVTLNDKDYPPMLRNMDDSPTILYARGRMKDDDKYTIAVVGSRKPTPYGRVVTEKLSSELCSLGFTIVSGMARGIDTAAHSEALKAGGRTIAVLGSGIDVPYPPENKGLMEKVSASGCVFSEFPPGAKPDKDNFPRRNRLISGLSLGVLVVEATSDSGALITAGYAAEQGKEVFAVPGNINSRNSAGTNSLIKKGAKLVQCTTDIIEELAPVLKGYIRKREDLQIDLSADERKLCDIMTAEPGHIDMISNESGMPVSKVLGILLNLELKGVVKQTEGKKFFLA